MSVSSSSECKPVSFLASEGPVCPRLLAVPSLPKPLPTCLGGRSPSNGGGVLVPQEMSSCGGNQERIRLVQQLPDATKPAASDSVVLCISDVMTQHQARLTDHLDKMLVDSHKDLADRIERVVKESVERMSKSMSEERWRPSTRSARPSMKNAASSKEVAVENLRGSTQSRHTSRGSLLCARDPTLCSSRDSSSSVVEAETTDKKYERASLDKKLAANQQFADNEKMKFHIREQLERPRYSMMGDYYKEDGSLQRLVRSPLFEKVTMLLVCLNTVWIWIDIDLNHAAFLYDSDPIFIIVENAFCIGFSTELILRFLAFGKKTNIVKDHWFVFDFVLLMMMVLETWVFSLIILAVGGNSISGGGNASVLRIARLLRLTRTARLARVLRAMPELVIMLKALKAATRSVFFTLLLLFALLYVWGISFKIIADDTDVGESLFSSVPHSMYSLLLYGVLSLDYLGDVNNDLHKDTGIHACIVLFLFVFFSALTVMNMLIGVLCEVVNSVAATEKEIDLLETTKIRVGTALADLDSDGNRLLSKDEMMRILRVPQACRAFHDVGVDVIGLVDFADAIFWDPLLLQEVELDFDEFMKRILELRDSKMATVKDVVNLGRLIRMNAERLDILLDEFECRT